MDPVNTYLLQTLREVTEDVTWVQIKRTPASEALATCSKVLGIFENNFGYRIVYGMDRKVEVLEAMHTTYHFDLSSHSKVCALLKRLVKMCQDWEEMMKDREWS